MEFNARYAVTGLFAIAVAAAMFGFVWWLENSGSFGERAEYRIRFTVPVSGLAEGGDVLFNGLKVGEVSGVFFDAQRPDSVVAVVSIAKATPVRQDTHVGVDYQGLTGSAAILMTGGSADSPALASDGAVPEIAADPASSRSWTQNAGRLLGRLDKLVEDNSGRFDGILAGLEKLAGGGSDDAGAVLHDLPAPTEFAASLAPAAWQLSVGEPAVALALNTDKILEETAPGSLRPLGEGRWTDNLPNLVQIKLLQSFENAGYTDAVLRPADAADPDYRLLVDIRAFNLSTADDPVAKVDLLLRLVDRNNAVAASKRFTVEKPAAGADEAAAVAALGEAFSAAAAEIVEWTVASAVPL